MLRGRVTIIRPKQRYIWHDDKVHVPRFSRACTVSVRLVRLRLKFARPFTLCEQTKGLRTANHNSFARATRTGSKSEDNQWRENIAQVSQATLLRHEVLYELLHGI